MMMLAAQGSSAQSAPDYWLPGGIKLLEEDRPAEFPDNKHSRMWVWGFNRSLMKQCGFQAEPADALLFGMQVVVYGLSAGSQAVEGVEDADMLVRQRGCQRAMPFFRTSYAVMGLHGGKDPNPEDFKKFVALASPRLLKDMGLSAEDVSRIKNTPVWWQPLIGRWIGNLEWTKPALPFLSLTLSLEGEDRVAYAICCGWDAGLQARITKGGQEALFYAAKSGSRVFVGERSGLFFEGRLSEDGQTISGSLYVSFYTPQTMPVTLVRAGPNSLKHGEFQPFRDHINGNAGDIRVRKGWWDFYQSRGMAREQELFMEDVNAIMRADDNPKVFPQGNFGYWVLSCVYGMEPGPLRRAFYWYKAQPGLAEPSRLKSRMPDHPLLLIGPPTDTCPLEASPP